MLDLSRSDARAKKAPRVQRLSGTGSVTTWRGRQISVEYHLSFPQAQNDASDTPSAAAVKEMSGQVWCPYDGSFVTVHQGKTLTLRIEDGRQLRFLYQNRDGGIAVVEWLG